MVSSSGVRSIWLRNDLESSACGRQELGRLFDAERRRQFARFGKELLVLRHLTTPAGHQEKDAQSSDMGIVDRGLDLGVRYVKLIRAKLLTRGRIRRMPQKRAKSLTAWICAR